MSDEAKNHQKGLDYVNKEIPVGLGEDLVRFVGYGWNWQLIKGALNCKYNLALNKSQLQALHASLLARTEEEQTEDVLTAEAV